MTELWVLLALLVLPLAAFIAWPILRRRKAPAPTAGVEGAQKALFREHEAELSQSLASGAIDETQYRTMHAELARKFLREEGPAFQLAGSRQGGRGLLFALIFAVPFCAVGLYLNWGAHDDLALYRDIVASQTGGTDMVSEARITQRLRERAESHPDDLTGRYVLAQRLLVSNDLPGAVSQYRYIVAHEPSAVAIRAELAQALFFASGSRMTPEVTAEVTKVLETQPNNATALGLAGIAAFEAKQFSQARAYWQQALVQMTPGSNAYQALAAGVARAEAALAKAGDEEVDGVVSAAKPDGAGAQIASDGAVGENSIRVKVTLAEAASASPETPVFIYARTAQSPMPLAIVRLTAADLPVEVVLDESRAMMPSRSLKSVDEVQLVARLAVSGNARPAPGDWQGQVESVPRSDWGKLVDIAIDEKI
ncbi:c-type cytochrome biogenesis protein CcmI [Microbulbifer aggregans]|uniref:c-type cytochrome biogenesis protein CcmI n=1 Tax=Microbulbifer aggregans TaxID=1769779 RepID=UPI001CFC5535|nr:c-type cytochrome biogenesis protein CcmI [Microbulbifer aggregans]